MLYLYTGTPGAGKTLSAIEYIVEQRKADPNRVIYAANIRGLKIPGVLELSSDDVHRWHELCEKGSLIVVDEAQRYWRAARSGEPERAIVEMETHRHDGIDIVMITQHPGLIHANIRKLINRHTHLVAYTDHSALRWEAREVREDVQDPSFRQNAEFKEWKYPVELYDLYDSAEKHTKAIKLSWREKWMKHGGRIAIVLFILAAGIVAWFFMRVRDGSAMSSGSGKPVAQAASSPRSSASQEAPVKWRTTADYVQAQIPRIPSQPWSAPLYDGQQPTTHPQVYCIAKADDSDCHCITEQGTKYVVAKDICLAIVKDGPAYDPFKPQQRGEREDFGRGRGGDRVSAPEAGEPLLSSSSDGRALPVPAVFHVEGAPVPMPSVGGSGPRSYDRSVGAPAYTPPEQTRVSAIGG